jgi:thiol-disulfide isomerase/thioredoxin
MGRETNKSRRQAQAQSAREKAAAARAAQRRMDQRRRALAVVSTVVVVAVVGAVIAIVAVNSGGSKKSSEASVAASSAVVTQIASVPEATLSQIGKGGAYTKFTSISDNPLTVGGKPGVLFVGGEFCPYCAGERWALIQALSRFGTFSGLTQIHSSESNIATFDFVNAKYTSKYVSFVAREIDDQNHEPLQKLDSTQQTLFDKYSGGGYFPFVYVNGKYVFHGADMDVSPLIGKNWQEIAAAMQDPSSSIAKSVDGEANYLTAAICKATGNKPAAACTSTVTGLQSLLPA